MRFPTKTTPSKTSNTEQETSVMQANASLPGARYIPSALLLTNDPSCRFRDPQFDPYIRVTPGATWPSFLQANSAHFPLDAANLRADGGTSPIPLDWAVSPASVTSSAEMIDLSSDRAYLLPAMRFEFARDRDAAPGARVEVHLQYTTPTLAIQTRELIISTGAAEAFTLIVPFSSEASSASYTSFAYVHNNCNVTAGSASDYNQTFYKEPPAGATSADPVWWIYGIRSAGRAVESHIIMPAGYHVDMQPIIPTSTDYDALVALEMSTPPTWANNVRKA